jgi:hypothetical protein
VGRETLFSLGFPDLLSGSNSTAGGALYSAGPYSINVNPALTAPLQRVSLDAGFTGLLQTGDDTGFAPAFHVGLVIPTRWGVLTGALQASFISLDTAPLGNTLLARGGFSRDVTDKLYIGTALYGGVNRGDMNDWAVAADFGFVYRFGALGFLKDARWGTVLSDVGKTLDNSMDGSFPGITTLKTGFAALFLDKNNFSAGLSADISAPLWQNLVFDTGLQFSYAAKGITVTLSTGWKLNVKETYNGHGVPLPVAALAFKFAANTSKSEFMSSRGWQETDLNVSGVWQRLYENVQVISAGVTANFGARDTEAPVIRLWEED